MNDRAEAVELARAGSPPPLPRHRRQDVLGVGLDLEVQQGPPQNHCFTPRLGRFLLRRPEPARAVLGLNLQAVEWIVRASWKAGAAAARIASRISRNGPLSPIEPDATS